MMATMNSRAGTFLTGTLQFTDCWAPRFRSLSAQVGGCFTPHNMATTTPLRFLAKRPSRTATELVTLVVPAVGVQIVNGVRGDCRVEELSNTRHEIGRRSEILDTGFGFPDLLDACLRYSDQHPVLAAGMDSGT